jgi:hypothetical protein
MMRIIRKTTGEQTMTGNEMKHAAINLIAACFLFGSG